MGLQWVPADTHCPDTWHTPPWAHVEHRAKKPRERGTKCISDPLQPNHFLTIIAAEAIQDGKTDPAKLAVVSAPNEGPDVLGLLVKLNSTVATSLHPGGELAQDTGIRGYMPFRMLG